MLPSLITNTCYHPCIRLTVSVPPGNTRGAQYMDQAFAALHQANPQRLPFQLLLGRHQGSLRLECHCPDELSASLRGQAIGSSKKRRQEAVYLLSEFTDIPEVVERIAQWLNDPDPQSRSWLIQTVENSGLKQYAPLLNGIIENDPDPFCRDAAIHAAGALRAEENLPALLRLAEGGEYDPTWRLAWALKAYATEDCRPYLMRWFEDSVQDKQTRVIAAWGLGKLGYKQAITYLVRMLDDPDRKGENFFAPGESIRAAQAISDIYEWPFEWNKSYVAKTC